MEYMKANFAHEFRTPFAAINVSLSSLQKVFPVLLEGYTKACHAGLMDNTFRHDYLKILENSVKNSLNEVKFCDHYLNRLQLLLQDKPLGSDPFERINLIQILQDVFSVSQFRESHSFVFISPDNFEVEFNKSELELCLQVLIEEILACKNEQRADIVTVHIDTLKLELSFEILKSKSNSYISECMMQFMNGDFRQRYGLGYYLLNQLLITKHGGLSLIEGPKSIQFLIRFLED